MGLRPCTLHHGRFRGAAQHAYPAMLAGTERVSRKHSLCPDEFELIREFALDRMTRVDDEDSLTDTGDVATCIACGQMLDEFSVAYFLTLYPKGEGRQDFFGEGHPSCKMDACAHLGLLEQGALKMAA